MANDVTNTLQQIWSAIIYRGLHEISSAIRFLNRSYEGECRLGKTVHVPKPDTVTIRDYTGAAITVEDMTPTKVDITVDQSKYWAFAVDDVQELHTKPQTVLLQLLEANETLAESIDAAIWAYCYANATITIDAADAPTAGTPGNGVILCTTPTATAGYMTPLQVLGCAARKLDKALVPRNGRNAIVCPEFIEHLISGGVVVATMFPGVSLEALREGQVQRLAGFNLQSSAKLTLASSLRHNLAFHDSAYAMAYALEKIETMRREAHFGDLLRGLVVFARQVLDGGRAIDIKISET